MSEKRKVRWDRVFILLLCVFLLIFFLWALFTFVLNNDKDNPSVSPNPSATSSAEVSASPLVSNTSENSVTLNSYKVYKSDDLDFGFVLADVLVSGEELSDLSLWKTSEGISLNDVSSYVNKAEEIGFDVYQYASKSINVNGNTTLFIPFHSDNNNLTLNINNQEITFDLNSNVETIKNTNNNSTGGEIKGDTYTFVISDAYTSDSMQRNDEEYSFPGTVKIYTFNISVQELSEEGIFIESASFYPSSSSDSLEALDGTFSSIRRGDQSIIGKVLSSGSSGALFFEIYSPEEEGITYEGEIEIKLSNGTNLRLSTSLN